jgi:hypothetical protein
MIKFITRLFGGRDSKHEVRDDSVPQDWKLTLDDLFKELNEGRRSRIDANEIAWAKAYGCRLIPRHYRFPRKGDRFKSKITQEVDFLTAWAAPYSGGGKGVLYEGEEVWVDSDVLEDYPVGVNLLPVDYRLVEERMVSSGDRNSLKYGGFYLCLSVVSLNEDFELIAENFDKEPYL